MLKKPFYVGNKTDTLNAILNILMKKTAWSDDMELLLDIVTLTSSERNEGFLYWTMLQDKYPFQICDISSPQCKTGFVYFLISISWKTFVHIGKTNYLWNRLQQHNSGYGSSSTTPTNLRPFAILEFICGFDNNNDLM